MLILVDEIEELVAESESFVFEVEAVAHEGEPASLRVSHGFAGEFDFGE